MAHRKLQEQYRHFGARIVLPFDQTPQFPTRCIGCEDTQPQRKWTPQSVMSPFSGKARYYHNHNMLPTIEVPVCDVCIDHMPGHTSELSSMMASMFAPLLFGAATLFFYSMNLYAVASACGIAAIVWFIFASRAVWVVEHSTLFDVQAGKGDSLIYYFRDEPYAQEFLRLNSDEKVPAP